MKRDPVKEYMKQNRQKRLAGNLGPELDEQVRQRVIANAKRYAAEQQRLQSEEQSCDSRRRKFRPAIAAVMVACLLMAVPMFAFGNRFHPMSTEPYTITALPDDYYFSLEGDNFALLNMQQLDETVTSAYTVSGQTAPITLIESHGYVGTFVPMQSGNSKKQDGSVPFYGQTMHYRVDDDGASGYAEFEAQKCLFRITAPTCTEEEFLDIVAHIQMQ